MLTHISTAWWARPSILDMAGKHSPGLQIMHTSSAATCSSACRQEGGKPATGYGKCGAVKLQGLGTFCDCLSFTMRMAVSSVVALLAFARVSTSPIITLRCEGVSSSSSRGAMLSTGS